MTLLHSPSRLRNNKVYTPSQTPTIAMGINETENQVVVVEQHNHQEGIVSNSPVPTSGTPSETTSLSRSELDNTLSQLEVKMTEKMQTIIQTSLQAILEKNSSAPTTSSDSGTTTDLTASSTAQITNGIFSQNMSSILTPSSAVACTQSLGNPTQTNLPQANLSTVTVPSPSHFAAGNLMDADNIFTPAPQQRVIKDNEVTVTPFWT